MGPTKTAIKRHLRLVTDRFVRPYVDEITSAMTLSMKPSPPPELHDSDFNSSTPPPDDQAVDKTIAVGHGTSDAFHGALHELRTIELERVPKGASRALSVGANGRWYFDWFERSVGPVLEHIGIEAFESEPDDLPGYVTWIPDTADRMDRVGDGSVDLVFAGQTTEHLWAEELTGFLLEARRVLTDGGLLVLDSPNRSVTERLLWSHGGHTVELDVNEITELVKLAGFDLVSTAGLWNCLVDGEFCQLEDRIDDPITFTRRAASGHETPDTCFVWWIVARRSAREPDASGLAVRTAELFEAHWDTRVSRGLYAGDVSSRLAVRAGQSGFLKTTLPFPLRAGPSSVFLRLHEGRWSDFDNLRIRIVAADGTPLHTPDRTTAEEGSMLQWDFYNEHLTFAVRLEILVDYAEHDFIIDLPITVRNHLESTPVR